VAQKRALDTEKYHGQLLTMRGELEREIKRSEAQGDQRDGFHVTSADEDFDEQGGDAASETVERSRVMASVSNLRDLLDEVIEALGKLEDGTYGKCDVCGKPIPKRRLDALPHATMCTECRQRVLGG